MATDDIMVIGDYGALQRRTAKSGKRRYTIEVKSEPLCIQTDAKALGRGVAQAIADHLRNRIEMISEKVKPATMRARLAAQKAFVAGEGWAQQRYGGGRLGSMAPARSDRMFNDSGRFARGIAVGGTSDGWVINAAANRLNAATLDHDGEHALVDIVQKLRALVPELGNPALMADSIPVRKALKESLASMIQKATDRTVELQKQLMRSRFEVLKAVVGG